MGKHVVRSRETEANPVPAPRERCASLKLGWFHEADALRALELARERWAQDSRTGKLPVRAYPCDDCTAWHLTSRPEWSDPVEARPA